MHPSIQPPPKRSKANPAQADGPDNPLRRSPRLTAAQEADDDVSTTSPFSTWLFKTLCVEYYSTPWL